jgi:hypothetical protein
MLLQKKEKLEKRKLLKNDRDFLIKQKFWKKKMLNTAVTHS